MSSENILRTDVALKQVLFQYLNRLPPQFLSPPGVPFQFGLIWGTRKKKNVPCHWTKRMFFTIEYG